MQLKGTGLILATMIIQILVILYVFTISMEAALLLCIDLALIVGTYFGFKNGKGGWAIFAIAYGIVISIMAVSNGQLFNVSGVLLLVGGILGVIDSNS